MFSQLQKYSPRNFAATKWQSRQTKCWVPWNPPLIMLMQLSVKYNKSCQIASKVFYSNYWGRNTKTYAVSVPVTFYSGLNKKENVNETFF